MNNLKYLLKNMGIMAVSMFGTNLVNMLMIPVYTKILTTQDYGTYDLFSITVGLLIPVVTLTVYDATLRFTLDQQKNKDDILIVSNSVILFGTAIVTAGLAVYYIFGFNNLIKEYSLFLVLMVFLGATSCNLINFIKGLDKVKEAAVSGIISSVVVVIANVLFLVVLKWGIKGFFISGILGTLCQMLYLFFACSCHQYLKGKNDKTLRREMLAYSCPLVTNNVAWWITNASDRYIVTWICGLSANGLYSVGYKIPSMLVFFQSIFNQAWVLSAVNDFDSEDREHFFSTVYRLYNVCMVMGCSVLILLTKVLAHFLYSNEFYQAWIYVPPLVISIIFGSLSSYVGGIFIAVKDTGIIAKSTLTGAAVNIVFNIAFVSCWGAMGAAIATLASYIIVWTMRMIHVRHYIKLELNIVRDLASYLVLIIQTVVLMTIPQNRILYPIESALVLIVLGLYINETKQDIKRIMEIKKRER